MPIHMAAQEGHLLIYQLLVQNVENQNPKEKDEYMDTNSFELLSL